MQKLVYCRLIDAEHALDPQYAQRERRWKICSSRNRTRRTALGDRRYAGARSGSVDIVVVDSVGADAKAEIEGEMAMHRWGLHARLMSKHCANSLPISIVQHAWSIFINQSAHEDGNPTV